MASPLPLEPKPGATTAAIDRWLRRGGTFARRVAVLAGGTVFAQGIVLLAMPVITGLYTAEQLGTLAIFAALLRIVSRVGAGAYDMAIPLPRDDGAAANLLALSCTVLLGLTGACALAIWVWGPAIVSATGAELLAPFLSLIPFGLLVSGVLPPLNYWALRHDAYADIARARITQALGMITAQVGAGIAGMGAGGLIAGEIIGRTAASARLALRLRREAGWPLRRVSLRGVTQAAVRYRRFPQFSSWAVLLNAASANLPPLLFTPFYGLEVTGWLALAQRVLGAPAEVMAQSVSQAFLPEAARAMHAGPGRLRRLYVRTSWRMLALGTIPFVALIWLGPDLFALLFGARWAESGLYARVLAIVLLARCVVGPFATRTLQVREQQGRLLAWEALRTLLVVIAIGAAGSAGVSATAAVAAYAAVMVLSYLILHVIALRASI